MSVAIAVMKAARMGHGKEVHYVTEYGHAICGAGKNSKGGSRGYGASLRCRAKYTNEAVTCERCCKIAAQRSEPKSDFQVGWDLYAAGAADSDCQTPEQVRGWWHALDADCTASMCSVLAADGVDSFEMDEVLDELHLAYAL